MALPTRHSEGGTAPGPPTTPSRTQLPNGALALLNGGWRGWGRFEWGFGRGWKWKIGDKNQTIKEFVGGGKRQIEAERQKGRKGKQSLPRGNKDR